MKTLIKWSEVFGVCFMVFWLTSCAGRRVVIGPTAPVDQGIPKELAQAFAVSDRPEKKEAGAAPLSPSIAMTKETQKKTEKKIVQAKPAPMKKQHIPLRRPQVDPIRVGEKVTMDVTWLRTTAGEMTLEVLPFKYIDERKVYHLKGTAKTTSFFANIYRAEDYVESFVDYEGWFPYRFLLHGDESKHIRDHLELFNHWKPTQYVYIRDDRLNGEIKEEQGYREFTKFSQDSLSSLFYVRTFSWVPGQQVKFPTTTSGTQSEVTITAVANEEIETPAGVFHTIKIAVEVLFKGTKKGDTFVWITNDDRKFLVKFHAKVRIGSVMGVAKRIELGM